MLPLDTQVRITTEEFPHGIGLRGKVVGHYQPYEDCPAHLTLNMVAIAGSKARVGFRSDELEVISG